MEYAYVEGERFISALAQRPNGATLIDRLLSDPPQDPLQILAPHTFPDHDREQRNQTLIKAALNRHHRWSGAPYVGIEVSPLKGINLRSNPARRQAAIDGFTRLIQSMVGIQFYNQTAPDQTPVEVTVMQAESAQTARLFADMMHQNTQHYDSFSDQQSLSPDSTHPLTVHLYRTATEQGQSFRTSIGVAGAHVVQVSGMLPANAPLDHYAVSVLASLNAPPVNAADTALSNRL